jgi:hypothetical protein
MSQEAASTPAFMLNDPDATVEIPPTPAVTAFDDTVTFLAPPAAESTAPLAAAAAAPAMDFGMGFPTAAATELTPVETQSVENLMAAPAPSMDFGMPAALEPELVAPAPITAPEHEVEFNSAPKAGPVKIVAESALESDENTNDISVSQDPSLVTDPTEIATAFVTKFGVENETEEIAEAEKGFSDSRPPIEAASASAEADDFEARVAAAMADFGDEASAAPVPEVIAPAIEEMQTVAPVEEAAEAAVELPASEPSIPEPSIEDTQKIEAVVEEVTEALGPASAPTASPEIDQVLVEQMHAAFADLPVETTPMEETQVIAAPPPPPAPVETAGHDLELASALARAVGAEPPQAAAAAAAGATSSDASATAQVVSRVLERMLPAIMAELAKELEANKKQ